NGMARGKAGTEVIKLDGVGLGPADRRHHSFRSLPESFEALRSASIRCLDRPETAPLGSLGMERRVREN
ncbi:hypothetical protein, partial [Streptomyces sp. CC224B]|uniref:hypothetical protein n=1 Tax=Streptomyces sp. CC224B TaxID=3044571 RepID=UPI0024A93A8A